ncbi:MAG: flagellar biosynthetic protein FliO [Planctomycetota bacterium]
MLVVSCAWSQGGWAQAGAEGAAAPGVAQQRLDRIGQRFAADPAPAQDVRPSASPTAGLLPHPQERKALGSASADSAALDASASGASAVAALAVDNPNESASLGESTGMASGLVNTLGALALVVAVILTARWVLTKRLGIGTPVGPTPSVEVLSRSLIAPKSHVLLLRVGSRILVVSDSSAGARTLSEVEDPEEVAQLLESVRAAQPKSFTGGFRSVLNKVQQKADAEEAQAMGVIDATSAALRDSEGLAVDGNPLPAKAKRDPEHAVDRTRDLLSSLSSRFRSTSTPAGGRP